MKVHLKKKAELLRYEGYSYSDIQSKISVSKSTLSLWLSNIVYTPNTHALEKMRRARDKANTARINGRVNSEKQAFELARKDIGALNKRDIFMLGIGIYIGGGTKSNNIIRVINADPKIIKFAMLWFKSILGFSNDNFRLRLHLYPDNNVVTSEKYWSQYLHLPRKFFHKSYIDVRKNKKLAKRGKLPYGTGHLAIVSNRKPEHGAFLFRRIKGWIKLVLDQKNLRD